MLVLGLVMGALTSLVLRALLPALEKLASIYGSGIPHKITLRRMESIPGPCLLAKTVGPIATAAATGYNTLYVYLFCALPPDRTKVVPAARLGAALGGSHNV